MVSRQSRLAFLFIFFLRKEAGPGGAPGSRLELPVPANVLVCGRLRHAKKRKEAGTTKEESRREAPPSSWGPFEEPPTCRSQLCALSRFYRHGCIGHLPDNFTAKEVVARPAPPRGEPRPSSTTYERRSLSRSRCYVRELDSRPPPAILMSVSISSCDRAIPAADPRRFLSRIRHGSRALRSAKSERARNRGEGKRFARGVPSRNFGSALILQITGQLEGSMENLEMLFLSWLLTLFRFLYVEV